MGFRKAMSMAENYAAAWLIHSTQLVSYTNSSTFPSAFWLFSMWTENVGPSKLNLCLFFPWLTMVHLFPYKETFKSSTIHDPWSFQLDLVAVHRCSRCGRQSVCVQTEARGQAFSVDFSSSIMEWQCSFCLELILHMLEFSPTHSDPSERAHGVFRECLPLFHYISR